MKRISKSISQKNLKFVKRISESVSEMYETDSEIRFTKKLKFVKRISESVSEKYETDFKFHFKKV